jgi:hypothetical protein
MWDMDLSVFNAILAAIVALLTGAGEQGSRGAEGQGSRGAEVKR